MRAEAEHLASKFPPLRLAARRLAATVRQGAHGRRRSGAGEAFWQFRPYQSFDTALAVDWRQSAKRGQVYVRQREWQTAQTVWLWRNGSASMAYASAPALPTKQARADLLVLALASLLAAGDEAVGLLGARARAGAGAVDAVAEGLDHPSGAAKPPRSAVTIARGGAAPSNVPDSSFNFCFTGSSSQTRFCCEFNDSRRTDSQSRAADWSESARNK